MLFSLAYVVSHGSPRSIRPDAPTRPRCAPTRAALKEERGNNDSTTVAGGCRLEESSNKRPEEYTDWEKTVQIQALYCAAESAFCKMLPRIGALVFRSGAGKALKDFIEKRLRIIRHQFSAAESL